MSASQHLIDRSAEVDNLLRDAELWASYNEKLGAHLAAYLTVLIAGMIEDCVESLFVQRAGKAMDTEVQNYVRQAIDVRFRNPDHGTISGLLKQFSDTYQQAFIRRVPHDGRAAQALRSIIDNKNALAHTGTWKLQMTVRDVRDYYSRVTPILEALENVLA